jgi:hypothetical protein
MQYVQRKLQRSVTEMRKSCSVRPSVSATGPEPRGADSAGIGKLPRNSRNAMTVFDMDQ